jgi:hypothetical protein
MCASADSVEKGSFLSSCCFVPFYDSVFRPPNILNAAKDFGCSAGVHACEFEGCPAPNSSERRDAAETRSRDGCVTRRRGATPLPFLLDYRADASQNRAVRTCVIFNPAARGEKANRFRRHLEAIGEQCKLNRSRAGGLRDCCRSRRRRHFE